jgi:hypothetical protein
MNNELLTLSKEFELKLTEISMRIVPGLSSCFQISRISHHVADTHDHSHIKVRISVHICLYLSNKVHRDILTFRAAKALGRAKYRFVLRPE